jgi:fido (protein-threonine AMPylation protein)
MRFSPFKLLSLGLLLTSTSASACPEILRSASRIERAGRIDLCALSDRYTAVLERYEHEKNRDASRVAGVLAPRFINGKDWAKANSKDRYNPWTIYAPFPRTWGLWENGRAIVDAKALENSERRVLPTLEKEWISELHEIALGSLCPTAGKFRTGGMMGISYITDRALSFEDIQRLNSPKYMSGIDGGRPLVVWKPTQCVDSGTFFRTLEKSRKTPPPVGKDDFFTDEHGVRRQCGYFSYRTNGGKVPTAFALWLKRSNAELSAWEADPASRDFVALVATIQRWFISIHPFTDGNGRISRYVLDLLVESVGLPTPVLADLNRDLMVTEPEWALEVERGMIRHVEILEKCIDSPARRECRFVKERPPLPMIFGRWR